MGLKRPWLVLVSVNGTLRFKDEYDTEHEANEMAEAVIQVMDKSHSLEITLYHNENEYSVYKRDAE